MNIKSISQTEVLEKWYLVDVTGQRIGIASSKIAELLMGKAEVTTREYLDPKIHVVVINCSKLDIPSKRAETKFYKRYSGFPSGLKFISLDEQYKKDPTFPIVNAVRGMLPKTKKGRKIIARLSVFENDIHKHDAQKPEVLDINNIKF